MAVAGLRGIGVHRDKLGAFEAGNLESDRLLEQRASGENFVCSGSSNSESWPTKEGPRPTSLSFYLYIALPLEP